MIEPRLLGVVDALVARQEVRQQTTTSSSKSSSPDTGVEQDFVEEAESDQGTVKLHKKLGNTKPLKSYMYKFKLQRWGNVNVT